MSSTQPIQPMPPTQPISLTPSNIKYNRHHSSGIRRGAWRATHTHRGPQKAPPSSAPCYVVHPIGDTIIQIAIGILFAYKFPCSSLSEKYITKSPSLSRLLVFIVITGGTYFIFGLLARSQGKGNTDKPNTDKPNTDKPNTDKPNTDKPNTDKPNTDKPNTGTFPKTIHPDSDNDEHKE